MSLIVSTLCLFAASARIVVFGDAQFDRGVRKNLRGEDPAPLFASTQALRDSIDVAMVNLETPLCDSTLPAQVKTYSLRSSPAFARGLARARFTHAILANNHVMDRGLEGLRQTIHALTQAGVATVGASVAGDPCMPVLAHEGTDSVALFAVAVLPGIDGRHVCSDPDLVANRISALARRGAPSVVSLHWGSEYDPVASAAQVVLAKRLIMAGAAAIVGHHAHVVQAPSGTVAQPTWVDGRPVWYGIGNFVFDQYQPWTSRALVAKFVIEHGAVRSETIELRRAGPRVEVVGKVR